MELTKSSSSARDLRYGHVPVGTVAVPLADSFVTRQGVVLKADKANSAYVYVGGANCQANNGPDGGMPLSPNQSIFIPIDDPSALYVISTDTDQDIAWMAV
jgi:hypothetical protein